MSVKYSDTARRRFDCIKEVSSTFFFFPKLVVMDGSRLVYIFNVESTHDGSGDNDRLFEMENDILDTVLHDHFLWILLKTGFVTVIDLLAVMKVRIEITNNTYKFKEFRKHTNRIYMITEAEECVIVNCSSQEIVTKMQEGMSDIQTTVEKLKMSRANFDKTCVIFHGFEISISEQMITTKCTLTGLSGTILVNDNPRYVLPWDDKLLLANDTYMWLLDIYSGEIAYTHHEKDSVYPLGCNSDMFYYLIANETQVCINCINKVSTQPLQDGEVVGSSSSYNRNQPSQDILMSQVKILVETILSATDVDHEESLKQIKNTFENIGDIQFLIDIVTQLYQHGISSKSILQMLQKRTIETEDGNLINQVCEIILKLDIIEYIDFRGISSYKEANIFDQNIIQLCSLFISNHDFDIASMCWLKYTGMKSLLTADDILEILNVIPLNTKMGALIVWLTNFVPPVLDMNPFNIDIFVRWTTERVCLLEKSSYWPKIGLKFIDEVKTILENSIKTVSIRPISMDDLDVLKDRLAYIMELKEKFKVNMLIAELTFQSPREVTLIMLHRCYTEDLEAFLQEYLPTFASRHSFELDDILRKYIESEAASGGGTIDGVRLKILLHAFRMPSCKLECLLDVLRILDVPWHTTVNELAVAAAAQSVNDFTFTDSDRRVATEIREELNFANVKVVLKKYNFPLTCTDYILVLHKIVNAVTVDVKDLKVIMNVTTTNINYGNVLFIDRCLRDGDTRKALDYFMNLAIKERRLILKSLLTKYEQMIDDTVTNKSVERCYIDFLKGTDMVHNIHITNLEHMYHLKNSYGCRLNFNNLYSEKILSEYSFKVDQRSSEKINSVVKLLGVYCNGHSELIELLHRTSASIHVRQFIENLITELSSDKVKGVATCTRELNMSLFLDACSVVVQLLSCSEQHLFFLTRILSVLNVLIVDGIVMKNLSIAWKFNYVFLPMSSVSAVDELMPLYKKSLDVDLYQEIFDHNSKSDIIPFRLMTNIMKLYTETEKHLDNSYMAFKDQSIKRLISKVQVSQDIDELLLTCLLIVANQRNDQDNYSSLTDLLKGQSENIQPTIISYLSLTAVRRVFKLDNSPLRSTISYSHQNILKTKYNLNLADIALPDITEETWDVKIILFYVLRQTPDVTVERLVDLCNTLNVSINDGLSLQLIAILSAWDLAYKIGTDELGNKRIWFISDEKALLLTCISLWESIENKDFLKDILNDFWKNGEVSIHGRMVSINPYFYEVYLCIYHLIFGISGDTRNIKQFYLLNFLKDYKRKSSPKQYEFELFSVKGMFPEVGHIRLPFHLFLREDMWLNLKSEITLETYELWLPAVTLLSLDEDIQTSRDMVCSNALKQTMKSRKPHENNENDPKDTEPWRLTSREEPLLRAAHRCVRHIANMEWAGACLFHVLQGCARGADQVAAAQLCYQFAQRWNALQPGNRAVRQMERLHSTLSTRHALHMIDWTSEELIRLCVEPAQLIRTMYLHPKFVDKMSRYDVNRTASEIADLNGINISSIRIQILDNILESSNENKEERIIGLDNRQLMTAKYILKATCPKMGAIYLSRIAFDEETNFKKEKKIRALQCFMSIVESDTAVKVTNRLREELWTSLLELYYIIKLEKADMPWAVETFIQNKTRAIEQVFATMTSNTEGLKLVAELTDRYGTSKLIMELLPSLIRASLYEVMICLLLKMHLPPNDEICKAWRAVLLTPFLAADYPITERQKYNCLKSINLLPLCPVICEEDLKEIWKNCIRCKSFGIGCLVLPYMTNETRQNLTELRKIDRRNLIASLKNLQSESYLVSGAMYVVENMSKYSR